MAPPPPPVLTDEEKRRAAALERDLAIAQREAAAALNETIASKADLLRISQQAAGMNEQEIAALNAVMSAQIAVSKAKKEDADVTYALVEAQRKANEAAAEFVTVAGAITDRIRGLWGITNQWKTDLVATFTVGIRQGDSFVDTLNKVRQNAERTGNKFDAMGSTIQKTSEVMQGGFLAIVSQTMKLAGALDSATVSFRRTSGASDDFVAQIPAMESKFRNLGLSMEEAAGVMGSLYGSMSGFTRMGPQSQKAIRDTTAVLETLGISSDVSARNMEMLTRAMGFSGTQAANVTQQLFGLAQQLNISTTKMMEDFSQLGPQMVVYGQRAVSVFVRLQASAKESGIEINRLLAIANKFDTFQSAADSVGRLNAVLGGPYLSVMRMVQQTDPSERMRMLAQATRAAGQSFESLGYYQRRALAEAAGLQDVNELALVMKGRFDLVAGSVNKNADEIERLAEENKKYKTVQQELAQAMRSLAVPATRILQLISGILNYYQESPAIINGVIVATLAYKSAMIGLNIAATAATAGVAGMNAAMMGVGGGVIAAVAAIGLFSYAIATEQHSPPLVAKNGLLSMMTQQTYGIGSAFKYAGEQAAMTAPQMRRLSTELSGIPDSKMIRITKVFNAEEGVLTASKGAAITSNTIQLLGAAAGAGIGGAPIQNHMDVTVEMEGRVVGHQVAKQLSDRAHYT
jgi:hypothetical protein